MISEREARQKHRAEAVEVPWDHTRRTSGLVLQSARVGSVPRGSGQQLREGLLHESLRLGGISRTTVGDIFCVQP